MTGWRIARNRPRSGRGRGTRRRAGACRLLRFHRRVRSRALRASRDQARCDPCGRRHRPGHAADRADSRARQLILLGDPIDAATALAWGLIDARRGAGQPCAEESVDFAQILAAVPARAMQYAKRAIIAAQNDDEAAALAMAREYAAQLSTSADIAEGVRSFLESAFRFSATQSISER